MTTTLSQRLRELDALLRELQGISATPGRETLGLIASCIAQAEAQEGQAGELSDEVIDRIGVEIETELVSADWSPVSVAVEVENFKRYARRLRPYLNPSQAIGEQTPVAPAPVCMGCFSQEAVCRQPGLCVSGRPKWTHSGVSPEARDRAIELVRAFVEVTRPADGLWLDTSHRNPIGLRFDADQYDELRDLHRQALSALRGS